MKTDTSAINIPTFELYGEQSQRQQAEFIHIEDISSRSKQHDWLIKPHRHGKLFQLLILFDGAAEVWLNEQTLALNGNWAISIPPGHVHGFRFPADTQGMVLTVMDSLLSDSQDSLVNNHFDGLLNAPHTIRFEEKQLLFTQLKHYLHLLQGEFQNAGIGQSQMLRWLVNMILMTLTRQQEHDLVETHHADSGKANLVMRFRTLLDQHYREHWTVQDYATALHVSTSTLSRSCKEYTGGAAKTLVLERLLLEIKRRLIYTHEPLDQMAYTLGFKDPAYFSRFFRQQEGVTLSQYRADKYRETGTVSGESEV